MALEILNAEQITERYGWSREYTFQLLKMDSCPQLPRKFNQPYRVIASEFEKWLLSRTTSNGCK